MKNILKLTALSIAMLFIGNSYAQSISSYNFIWPQKTIKGGGSVYVKPFSTTGDVGKSFGTDIASALKTQLSKTNKGQVSGVKNFNPWLTTSLYKIVDSESDADIIVSGEYIISGNDSKNIIEKKSKEGVVNQPITYYYAEYSASAKANIKGKITVTKGGSLIEEIPFSDTKSKTKTSYMTEPSNTPTASKFVAVVSKNMVVKNQNLYSPSFKKKNFNFKKVKTKDKAYKKELKTKNKSIKANCKSNNINEVAKAFIEMEKTEPSLEVSYNIGLCYQLIGNYTKSLEYFNKSGNKGAIKEINHLIAIREAFKGLGLPVEENDF